MTGRVSSPWITTDEPCPSGDTDCTVDCGSCKGTGKRVTGRSPSQPEPTINACPLCANVTGHSSITCGRCGKPLRGGVTAPARTPSPPAAAHDTP